MAHRIDHPTALPGGFFTEGDPVNGTVPTRVTDDWLNDLQENLVRVVEGAGITLVKGNYDQLLAAIQALASGIASASEILARLQTVDGSGSGLDADLLDGQHGSFYQNAGNLNAGTIPNARFPSTLPALNGSALTALNASNLGSGTVPAARMPALTGDATTSAGSTAVSIAAATILAKLLTVDGTGSGLDADTVRSAYIAWNNIDEANPGPPAQLSPMGVGQYRPFSAGAYGTTRHLLAPSGGNYYYFLTTGEGGFISGGGQMSTTMANRFSGFIWRAS